MQILESENNFLKSENQILREKNTSLTKQVQFYKRAVDQSLNSQKEEIDIIIEPGEECYQRVDGNPKASKFAKAFLLLTVFTIMIQTVNSKTEPGNILNSVQNSSQLNFFSVEKVGSLVGKIGCIN